MEPKEVLAILDRVREGGFSNPEQSPQVVEAFYIAYRAVGKMEPIKPGPYELPVLRPNHIIKPCGNCGEDLEDGLWEYCPWCGQKIDWGRR